MALGLGRVQVQTQYVLGILGMFVYMLLTAHTTRPRLSGCLSPTVWTSVLDCPGSAGRGPAVHCVEGHLCVSSFPKSRNSHQPAAARAIGRRPFILLLSANYLHTHR